MFLNVIILIIGQNIPPIMNQKFSEAKKTFSGRLRQFILDEINQNYGFKIEHFIQSQHEILNDKEIIFKLVKDDFRILQYVNRKLLSDKSFALEVINISPHSLELLGKEIKDDEEVVSAAIQLDGETIEYASERILNNKSFALKAVQSNGIALFSLENFQNDKEIVLAAVQRKGFMLDAASDNCKNDKEIVMTAIQNDCYSFGYAGQLLQEDKEFVMSVLKYGCKANGTLLEDIEVQWMSKKYFAIIQSIHLTFNVKFKFH
jgi:hypothetical protein